MKKYILSASMVFICCHIQCSDNSEIFSWIQSTLLHQKIEKTYPVGRSEEDAEFLFVAYKTRKYEELALVKNDQIKISKKASVSGMNNNPTEFVATLEGRVLSISSALALRHRWISSKDKPHASFFYLQERNFESCPVVGAYEKLLDFVKKDEAKVFFRSSKSQK